VQFFFYLIYFYNMPLSFSHGSILPDIFASSPSFTFACGRVLRKSATLSSTPLPPLVANGKNAPAQECTFKLAALLKVS
jgi:hypothetical protein